MLLDSVPNTYNLDTDDDGLHWTPGTCHCDYELAEAMFEIIAQGLSKLDMVLVRTQYCKTLPSSSTHMPWSLTY